MTLLTITQHTSIRIAEVGFALAAIAGGLLFLGAITPFGRKSGNLLGGACLAAGSVLVIVAIHWGNFG